MGIEELRQEFKKLRKELLELKEENKLKNTFIVQQGLAQEYKRWYKDHHN